MPNISSVIKSIQDIMRKDTGVDGDAQRLSQIVWMLFLKIFADKEEEAEIMSDDYTSPLEEKYRWSVKPQMEGVIITIVACALFYLCRDFILLRFVIGIILGLFELIRIKKRRGVF